MTEETRPVTILYEVECTLDPAIASEFDAWLPGHVEQVLGCPGFLGARMLQHQSSEGVAPVRRVVYRLESRGALEDYLRSDAQRLRADATQRFGDRVQFARRVLAPLGADLVEAPPAAQCLNCGATVRDRFCASCGQRRDVHVKSVGEVFHDITHTITHLDSTTWRTLKLLVLRPGALTLEFLAGRLASYLPPFRLYLVASLLYFTLGALIPGNELSSVSSDGQGESAPAAIVEELRQEAAKADADPAATPAKRQALHAAYDRARAPGHACELDFELPFMAGAGPKLTEACRRIEADGGKRFLESFRHNAPKLMFLFVPLVAAFALLLYWRPRRLYAEHLVQFLHGHALLFLVLALSAVLNGIRKLVPAADAVLGLLPVAAMVWLVWYYYRAMRVVYGQGRWLTAAKFITLSFAYFILLGVTMAAGVLFTALSL
jgi:Protein of unknown function (DUF3667)/Domain of unknown function (DUF4286)